MGQTAGPIAYGASLAWAGKFPTLAANAIIIAILGLVCARLLVGRTGSSTG